MRPSLAEWLRLEDHEVMAFARAGLFPRTPDGRFFPLVRAIKNFIRLQEARSAGEPFLLAQPSTPAEVIEAVAERHAAAVSGRLGRPPRAHS